MMSNMKDASLTTGSGGALLLPWWIEWLPEFWQLAVTGMGGAFLALGVYSKFLEIKQRHRDLDSTPIEEKPEEEPI